MDKNPKIVFLQELLRILSEQKSTGKKIVQTHGVFDLIHPGIIRHIEQAGKQGDIMVVTVIKDKDVKLGPGRPIFSEQFRAENVAALSQVDYVCIVDDDIPFECVKTIAPDVFAKGRSSSPERDRLFAEKVYVESDGKYLGNSRVHETDGYSFSSSSIINNLLDIYSDETKDFIRNFKEKHSFASVCSGIDKLRDTKILIIGDGIIDEYHYCTPMGKSGKNHLIVNKYSSHEVFAGGAFAVANHVAGICSEVTLVSLLGAEDSRESFIGNNLKSNVKTRFFTRDDGPTIIKKRYVTEYSTNRNTKLFEVNYLNENYIDSSLESEIINYLEDEIPRYDMVMACDFGHGLLTDGIIRLLERKSKKLAVNTQTNAANSGYNVITKYRNPAFVCLDESEARLALRDKFGRIDEVADKLIKRLEAEYLVVTLGSRGSFGITAAGETSSTPVFSLKVIDTIGAGDAFFSYTAPCVASGLPLDMITFIGNAVGALAVQIICNKKSIDKDSLLGFIGTLFK